MFRRFMFDHIVAPLVVGFSILAVAPCADAQEKSTKHLQELLAAFPTPAKKDGKLAEVNKDAADAAVAELLKDPSESITGLIDLLSPKGGDTQARQALHAIVMRVGGDKDAAARQAAARALAATVNTDRPKDIQRFVVSQLQLIGDAKQAAALGKLLLDTELAETAAQVLLAIKVDVADEFRAALGKASGKQRALIAHGLGTLKDKPAAGSLLKLLDDDDRDTRLTAAWALANLPDGNATDKLLKLADAAKGYERSTATDSCLLLAENLLATGDKTGARRIYSRLHDSRTDAAERFVKEAAANGLAATK
jgi:HEAT repeat protein